VEQAVAHQVHRGEDGPAAVGAAQSVQRRRPGVDVHAEGETQRREARVEDGFMGPDAGHHFELLHLGLLEPLGFGAAVLEPDLDLGLGQRQRGGELGPLGDGQVPLVLELPLQRQQLRTAEGRAGLAVGFVRPQGAGGRAGSCRTRAT